MRPSELFLTGITLAAVYLTFRLVEPFLLAIAAAMVFAVVFHPLYRRVLKLVRARDLAAFLSTVLILGMVVIPTSLITYAAARELKTAYQDINQKTKQRGGWLHAIDEATGSVIDVVSSRTGIPAEELRSGMNEKIEAVATAVLGFGSSLVAGLGSSLAQAVISFVTLFFFLRDGRRFVNAIAYRIPLPRENVDELLSQANDTIVANMYGVLAVAAAQGLLTGLAIWWTGLPSPVLWGVLTAVFSVIPVVGSGIVWLPASIFLLATGNWGKGLFLIVWGAAVVSMVDNIVRPMVVSERTQLNPLLVFFSLLGGTQLFGLIGVFLGPVLMTVTLLLLDLWSQLPRKSEAAVSS